MKSIQSEMKALLAEADALCGSRQWWDAAVLFDIAGDVWAKAQALWQKVADMAYASEQADLEALRLMAEAQKPDSDGGAAITPAEARPIARHVQASARKDHNVSELLSA